MTAASLGKMPTTSLRRLMIGDLSPLLASGLGIVLGKRGANPGRTRQRCQVALSTLAIAAFSPSWASEITSLTPRRPRRERAQELGPERFGFTVADGHAEHFAAAVGIDRHSDDHRH